MNVLIADDDPVVRQILQAILTDHTVQVAVSGAECLTILRAQHLAGIRTDVVFLDLQLQDMHGTEVLREIRREFSALTSAVPTPVVPAPAVVVLSGNSEAEVRELDPEFSPELFLEKPFTAASIADALKAVRR
jgi:CheY-like chemotaxis protein